MTQRPPEPTTCRHCGYSNGGAFSRCPLCKKDVVHLGDTCVGIAALIVGIVYLALTAGGFA